MKKVLCVLIVILLSVSMNVHSRASDFMEAASSLFSNFLPQKEEVDIEPDLEWFNEAAIDEVRSCLFPVEGQIDIRRAQEILLPLVENGNAEAQYYWGFILDNHIQSKNGESEKEALYWFRLAAKQGYPKAYLAAALSRYIESQSEADNFIEAARQLGIFDMSPEELAPDGCSYLSAYYYILCGDYGSAMTWALHASEGGDPIGMNNVGVLYFFGAGVEQDYNAALDWSLKAAELGYVTAMVNYANTLIWSMGEKGAPENAKKYDTALEWANKAAEAGNADAMELKGLLLGGEIHKQFLDWDWYRSNTYDQKVWYEKAINAGSSSAMYSLGCLLRDEYQDYDAAMRWLIKAYANGVDSAAQDINNMLSNKQGLNGYFENYGDAMKQ